MSASASNAIVIQVRGARPIPVGHRVEIRVFYSASGTGFFGTGAPEPQLESPLITDLDTGIAYGALEQFHPPVTVYTVGELFSLALAPLPELREHSRWQGKIIVCNVIYTGMKTNEIQTTLLIEPIVPGTGYR
jgi:hypothetical protein